MDGIDRAFSKHAATLDYLNRRQQVIASNLAHADTPGYKAKDISFPEAMKQTQSPTLGMATTNPGHRATSAASVTGDIVFRQPTTQSIDGNTVDTQREMAAFTDNALRLEAALKAAAGEAKSIRAALE